MGETGRLIGEDLLGAVDVPGRVAEPLHLVDRQSAEVEQQLLDLGVVGIAPELVVVEHAGAVDVEPDVGPAGGLAELLPAAVHQQRNGHAVNLVPALAADQFGSGDHVAPLVLPAHFELAAVVAVEDVEVVPLEDRVVEFEEGESVFQPGLDRLLRQHPVDAEDAADFAEHFDVADFAEPVGIVDEERLPLGVVDEAPELRPQAADVFLDGFERHHRPGGDPPRGVADLRGRASDQHDRNVPRLLQQPHRHHRQQMADVQAVAGRVEADVEPDLFRGQKFFDRLLVGLLVAEAPCFEFLIDVHDACKND